MDIAVGKFIRILPWFETALILTRDLVDPGDLWADLEKDGAKAAVATIEEHLSEFPTSDHFGLELYLGESKKVWELRQAIVHGFWTEHDPVLDTYLSERPVRPGDANRLGLPRVPGIEPPLWRREFNAGGVMAGWASARSVARYVTKKRRGWAEHFGST